MFNFCLFPAAKDEAEIPEKEAKDKHQEEWNGIQIFPIQDDFTDINL